MCVLISEKWLSMIDREDEESVVEDNFENFQKLYLPIVEEQFKDVMEIKDGKLLIVKDDHAARKLLASHINDNVYKNLKTFSPLLFDETQTYSKAQFDIAEKNRIVEKLIAKESNKQVEYLHYAVDRILLAHRNLKLVLFCTTGPFLVALQTFKYILKFLVLYALYKGSKGGDNKK